MAELVGLAASIIQIAGAGAKLSTTLYNFVGSATRADQEISDIAGDVEITANALDSVGKVFENEEAKSVVSKKAIQDANNLIKRCEAVFGEIDELIEKRRKTCKDGKKKSTTFGKLAWPLKEQRVELLRRRLESLKNSLILLFHVLQLANGQVRGQLEKSALEEEREKIRQLHQRQQNSLKTLQALESKLSIVSLDDNETLRGSNPPSRIPTVSFMVNQSFERGENDVGKETSTPQHPSNAAPTVDEDSDDSESDETITDEGSSNEDHLTIDDLSKCTTHIQKLLKRIGSLQRTLECAEPNSRHLKRRVRRVYRRFCRKFESDLFSREDPAMTSSLPLPTFQPHSKTKDIDPPLLHSDADNPSIHGSESSIRMAIKSGAGHTVYMPVDVQAASRVVDEKRKRNAGASARFRARRREKEREATMTIQLLEQTIERLKNPQGLSTSNSAATNTEDVVNEPPNDGLIPPKKYPEPPTPLNGAALQDYQMQMILLEQQNKKRLLMAQQQRDLVLNRQNQPGSVAGHTPETRNISEPSSPEPSSLGSSIQRNGNLLVPNVPPQFPARILPPVPQPPLDHSTSDFGNSMSNLRAANPSVQIPVLARKEKNILAPTSTLSPLVRHLTPPWRRPINSRLTIQTPESDKKAMRLIIPSTSALEQQQSRAQPSATAQDEQRKLEEYQSGLLTLYCGSKRRGLIGKQAPEQQKTTSTVDAHRAASENDANKDVPPGAAVPFGQVNPDEGLCFGILDGPDALEIFDFDSFLHVDSTEDFASTLQQNSPALQSQQSPNPGTGPEEESPLFVNAKQFDRILKRRIARQVLEQKLEETKPSDSETRRGREEGTDDSGVTSESENEVIDDVEDAVLSEEGNKMDGTSLSFNSLLSEGLDISVRKGRPGGRRMDPLTPEQGENAALLRKIGRCDRCKKWRDKCDLGTPCKRCVRHTERSEGGLGNETCRGVSLADFVNAEKQAAKDGLPKENRHRFGDGESSDQPLQEDSTHASPIGSTTASDPLAPFSTLRAKMCKRTKAGCLTCRKRRIKCGEERPTCTNCAKSKHQCEGYNQRVVFKPPIGDWLNHAGGLGMLQYHNSVLPETRTRCQAPRCAMEPQNDQPPTRGPSNATTDTSKPEIKTAFVPISRAMAPKDIFQDPLRSAPASTPLTNMTSPDIGESPFTTDSYDASPLLFQADDDFTVDSWLPLHPDADNSNNKPSQPVAASVSVPTSLLYGSNIDVPIELAPPTPARLPDLKPPQTTDEGDTLNPSAPAWSFSSSRFNLAEIRAPAHRCHLCPAMFINASRLHEHLSTHNEALSQPQNAEKLESYKSHEKGQELVEQRHSLIFNHGQILHINTTPGSSQQADSARLPRLLADYGKHPSPLEPTPVERVPTLRSVTSVSQQASCAAPSIYPSDTSTLVYGGPFTSKYSAVYPQQQVQVERVQKDDVFLDPEQVTPKANSYPPDFLKPHDESQRRPFPPPPEIVSYPSNLFGGIMAGSAKSTNARLAPPSHHASLEPSKVEDQARALRDQGFTLTQQNNNPSDDSKPAVSDSAPNDDLPIKCICGSPNYEDDLSTVLCEKCRTWQHVICYYDSSDNIPDIHACVECSSRSTVSIERELGQKRLKLESIHKNRKRRREVESSDDQTSLIQHLRPQLSQNPAPRASFQSTTRPHPTSPDGRTEDAINHPGVVSMPQIDSPTSTPTEEDNSSTSPRKRSKVSYRVDGLQNSSIPESETGKEREDGASLLQNAFNSKAYSLPPEATRRSRKAGKDPEDKGVGEEKGGLGKDQNAAPTTCTNCFTQTTPLWRQTPEGHPLCNACGLFLKIHGVVRPLSLKTDVIKKRNRGSEPLPLGGKASTESTEEGKLDMPPRKRGKVGRHAVERGREREVEEKERREVSLDGKEQAKEEKGGGKERDIVDILLEQWTVPVTTTKPEWEWLVMF